MSDETRSRLERFIAEEQLLSIDATLEFVSLTGGVSSEIVVATAGPESVCIKRALSKLNVAADWQVPVKRSATEAAWLQFVSRVRPGFCPRVLAYDESESMLAMEYMPPDSYSVWKQQLLEGFVDPATAMSVASRLVGVHNLASVRPELAEQFNGHDLFRALRIDPYLGSLAARYPALSNRLERIAAVTLATQKSLVHGDMSPKNILIGEYGPMFLDAECACWCDPAFDLGFCLNHLLLKCLAVPARSSALLSAAHVLASTYFAGVFWESPDDVDKRAAELLPALLLARVDGWSPVEYLDENGEDLVRRFAPPLILRPVPTVHQVIRQWGAVL